MGNRLEQWLNRALIMSLGLLIGCPPGGLSAAPGDLDSAFGDEGTLILDGEESTTATKMLALEGGGILALGSLVDSNGRTSMITKRQTDGAVDTSFGVNGWLVFNLTGVDESGIDIAIQTDGKFLVLATPDYGETASVVLARFNPNGQLDGTFGVGGRVVLNLGGVEMRGGGVIGLQPDGKVLVLGYDEVVGFTSASVVTRIDSEGGLDETFGDGGWLRDFGSAAGTLRFRDLAVMADGRFVLGGELERIMDADRTSDFAVGRYLSDGSPDLGFGVEGVATRGVEHLFTRGGAALVVQPDGKILLGGEVPGLSGWADFAMVRWEADGTLDETFGVGGEVNTHFPGMGSSVVDLIIGQEGKIYATGRVGGPPFFTFVLGGSLPVVRYRTDGTLDTGFGAGGMVVIPQPTSSWGASLALLSSGDVVVWGLIAGQFLDSLDSKAAFMRVEGGESPALVAFGDAAMSAGLAGLAAGMSAEPRNDGVPNLLKYAFNMNLAGEDRRTLVSGTGQAGLPAIMPTLAEGSGPVFRYEFLRRIGSGLVYTPMKSVDLSSGSWTPLTSPPQSFPIDTTWERVVHEEPFDPSVVPHLFGTVRVEVP